MSKDAILSSIQHAMHDVLCLRPISSRVSRHVVRTMATYTDACLLVFGKI